MLKSPLNYLFAALALTASWGAAADPVVIKFSHVVTDDTPKGKGALLFQKLVQERLSDKFKVEIYPNSTLYGDNDEMAALLDNKVQIIAPSLSKLDQYTKQLEVFDLPFLFDDLNAVQRFQRRDTGQRLLGAMASKKIVGLGFWNNGMKQFTATKELRKPSDAQGLVFRIQASNIITDQFSLIGATAVKLPFAQSFSAMQSGKVQGTENTWSNLYSQKLHTVQPYMTETNHGVLSYMLMTNATFWNSLPFDTRSRLQAIADEVTVSVNRDAEAINAKNREMIVSSGTSKLLTLTPAERQAWRDAMAPLLQKYSDEIGADVIQAAQTVNRKAH